jgi:RimJ/RimL family protein N-acetyltransferase
MDLTFSPMDEISARAILAWRYDEPYAFYNPNPAELGKDVRTLTDPANLYYASSDEDSALVAYYCFGREAQVMGGDYSADALDIGGGVRPDLTGQGFGSTVIAAGLDFGRDAFTPRAFRVTVASFNRRALRLCEKMGFFPSQKFRREQDGVEFIVLIREA